MAKAETTFSLKDRLFNLQSLTYFYTLLYDVYPHFSVSQTVDEVLHTSKDITLMQVFDVMSDTLYSILPKQFDIACTYILDMLPEKSDEEQFVFGALCHYVNTYGCTPEHLSQSLKMLKILTQYFTAEFAIRDFINTFEDETYAFLQECTQSNIYQVRRLASEGSRPNLPWGKKCSLTPEKTIPLLYTLYTDSHRVVTRSVANHLNDISKTNPQLVIQTLTRWKTLNKQSESEMEYIISHALRTLIKQGNIHALSLLGYADSRDSLNVSLSMHKKNLTIPEKLDFTLEIECIKDSKLLIDYIISFPRKNGSKNNKVFKLKKTSMMAGESQCISKSHLFQLMSSRSLYNGEYSITIQINGYKVASQTFTVGGAGEISQKEI